ncbi:MAG: helix-turn-helix domain-containing protein [Patescibacteria group bacterium]
MKITDALRLVGLSDMEAKVYLCLLEHGPNHVSGIAKRTGVHRPGIYQALPELTHRGLVTLSPRKKQKWYSAEPPAVLEQLLDASVTTFKNALPDLQHAYEHSGNKPIVKFFEGVQGIRFVYEDLLRTLKKGDVFYRYSARKEFVEGERYLPTRYRERRDQKQLQRFVITSESVRKQKKPRLERAIRVIPSSYGVFDFGVTQVIYGNKIAFIDYNTDTATIVENPLIAQFQTKLFKVLFDTLK